MNRAVALLDPEAMSISQKVNRALRGNVGPRAAALEVARRLVTTARRRRDRKRLGSAGPSSAAQLTNEFAMLNSADLLEHFRNRTTPKFFPFEGTDPSLMAQAVNVMAHRWPILGFGEINFGAEIDWLREPVSGMRWSLDYHADVVLVHGDGSDVRVLWEMNRLAHLLVLARAYAQTSDEPFAEEVFKQIKSWDEQNPIGLGPNWACAMEVALRATNLIAVFHLLRNSRALDEQRLMLLLNLFDAHGRHIQRNLEYSYVATGNHYLSDVAGLLWLGVCLPELATSNEWREFGLRELLREVDKQVLADGTHYESSTAYHRYITELVLCSFILCSMNDIDIADRHWSTLYGMLVYIRACIRPDGSSPIIGDNDGSRWLGLADHDGNDHAYLVNIGAALFRESNFKLDDDPPIEIPCLLGADGLDAYSQLQRSAYLNNSAVFKDAGIMLLRDQELYLLMSASKAGMHGRGAHAHNDALSIEVAIDDSVFIADPGSYVYTGNPQERNLFRSTGYHSTVTVDRAEQNSISEVTPFIRGDEAQPQVVEWFEDEQKTRGAIEHYGYRRLPGPVTHRRTVTFHKTPQVWLVTDDISGEGKHELAFRFHLAPNIRYNFRNDQIVEAIAPEGVRLLIVAGGRYREPDFEEQSSSVAYGAKAASTSVVWRMQTKLPVAIHFTLIPIRADEDEAARLSAAMDLTN